ncbi:MAG: glycosyltransferase family 2 protein [Bradyrhizobium sp.]|uniref:glycosyltransferase family 2 protein n=1 Tax=Bradyrhizobium sp. TaxID=376 RepID=UPI0025BAD0B9|nr:glycosyltransferase family 2 protein [Bradyrhizobium sp.]MBI5261257.1 glycosyltransferase family 2 protein [Bradyrhizobium sp.]
MTSNRTDGSDPIELSIVIPVFNEKDNIQALIDEINSVGSKDGWKYEIIVVDDGSTDGSAQAAGSKPNVTVIRFRRNFGQTAAFDAGFHAARYKYIVTMDGDGQNDPNDIPNLIAHLNANDLDVVSGWRVDRQDTVSKHVISRGANLLRKIFLNDSIHDSGCSLKIYRRECFDSVRLYGEMHRFVPALLEMRGFSIGEIAVNHRPRRSGKTKYNAVRTIKGLADIVLLWFWRTYSVRPIHLLGGIGVLFFLISAFFGIRTLYLFVADQKLSSTLEPLLTVFSFIAGLLFLSLGILTDILIKIYYAIVPEPYYSVWEVIRNGTTERGKEHLEGFERRGHGSRPNAD